MNLGYFTKPTFIVVGAQKAGTSGFCETLNQHGCIAHGMGKEIHYFDDDPWYSRNKISEYHRHFPLPYRIKSCTAVYESTPMYLFHPRVPERLYQYNPHLKIIIILRNPVYRALSAWKMHHFRFNKDQHPQLHDSRTFSEAITEEIGLLESQSFEKNKIAYIKRGIYIDQIKAYLKYFPADQILILENKEILNLSTSTSTKIQSFLKIPFEQLTSVRENISEFHDENHYLNEIEMLKEFYKTYNNELFKFLGKTYDWNV